MSNEKHTPGPWGANLGQDDVPGIWTIGPMRGEFLVNPVAITAIGPNDGKDILRNTANARLIAAAPDLLESMQALFKHCSMIHSVWGENCNLKEANAAIERARAAIAKAKGE